MKTIYHPKYALLIEKLIDERKRIGMTQVELAKKLGKHQSYVAKVEVCERKLDVIEFVKWCQALGLAAGQLISNID